MSNSVYRTDEKREDEVRKEKSKSDGIMGRAGEKKKKVETLLLEKSTAEGRRRVRLIRRKKGAEKLRGPEKEMARSRRYRRS